jgi:hypothetical protein
MASAERGTRSAEQPNPEQSAAMAVLLKCPPGQRVRCAAGLLFAAAGEDENAGRQLELADLSRAAEKLANELSRP